MDVFSADELQRLPKWAREKVLSMGRKINEQAQDVTELSSALDFHAEPGPGSVEVDPYGKYSRPKEQQARCFPKGTAVDFHIGQHYGFRVMLRPDGKTLDVNFTGGGGIAIYPRAANSIEIKEAGSK